MTIKDLERLAKEHLHDYGGKDDEVQFALRWRSRQSQMRKVSMDAAERLIRLLSHHDAMIEARDQVTSDAMAHIAKLDNGLRWITALAWQGDSGFAFIRRLREILISVGYTPETLEQPSHERTRDLRSAK